MAFQGQWDKTVALCDDPEGVSRLTVGPTRLGYYESGGVLSGPARQRGDRVQGTFDMDGADLDYEGVRPEDLLQSGELVMTDHGNGLVVTLQGRRETYVRCARNRV